jgi:hypothetical protein
MTRSLRTLAVVLSLFWTGGRAWADAVPAKNQALLMFRILAYDRNLASRIDNKTVTIAIVYKAGNAGSEDVSSELVSSISDLAKSTTIVNNAIRVLRIAYADKTFDADLAKAKASTLYVASGLGDNIAAITASSRARKLLSFGGNEDDVAAGVAVGFALVGDKASILVNVPASRAEGADLDSALLRVARIVKR